MALAAPAAVALAAEHGHAHGEPTINWWDWQPHAPPMGWFLLDFVLFAGGLVYFARKPLASAFAERHTSIKRAIGEAASAHAKAASRQSQARDKLARVESEAQALMAQSQEGGAAEHAHMVKEATAYADRMQQDTKAIAEQESQRATMRLRQALAKAALSRASDILAKELNDGDRQRLLEQSIAELESGAAFSPVGRVGHVEAR